MPEVLQEADWMTYWPAAHKNTFAGNRQNTDISWHEVALKFVKPLLLATGMCWKGMRWWKKYQAFKKHRKIVLIHNGIGLLF